MRIAGIVIALCLGLAALFWANQPPAPGFVQIVRQTSVAKNDVFRLNETPLENIGLRTDMVLRQNAGPAHITLERDGRSWRLCSFVVGSNRIVSARIHSERGLLRCAVNA